MHRTPSSQIIGPTAHSDIRDPPPRSSGHSVSTLCPKHTSFAVSDNRYFVDPVLASDPSLFSGQGYVTDVPLTLWGQRAEDDNPTHIISKLFPDEQLGHTLKYCFDELELFYPCIDRLNFYDQLSDLFVLHCVCHGKYTRIPREQMHVSLAALACMLLAIGTYLGGNTTEHESQIHNEDDFLHASLSWHAESRMLLRTFDWTEQPNFDILRLHILEVIYMTMIDRKGALTKSMVVAIDLAFSLQLHDERTWGFRTAREKAYLQLLWWTLYYMDRRIALRFERPLLIRDMDFVVSEFDAVAIDNLKEHVLSARLGQNASVITKLAWPPPSNPPDGYFDWLHFRLEWSKIVTRVWDTGFLRRTATVDPERVYLTDSLLSEVEDGLPFNLRWETASLPCLISPGVMDRAYRLKLIVFEVSVTAFPASFSCCAEISSRQSICCVCLSEASLYETAKQ